VVPDKVDYKQQDKVIEQLIAQKVDGIVISVSQSSYLAINSMQRAMKVGRLS